LKFVFASTLLAVHLALLASPIAAATDPLDGVKRLLKDAQYEKALPRLNSFLKENPEHAEARFLKGMVLAENGNAEEAQEVFLALTVDYPELPEPHNNLAVLYAANGEYALARNALIQAISHRPNYATAHENLGDIYARMAGIAYGKALEIDTDNRTARVKLAMVRELFSERGPAASSAPQNDN